MAVYITTISFHELLIFITHREMCIAGILIVSILCYKDITTITYYRIQKLPTCVAVCFIDISFHMIFVYASVYVHTMHGKYLVRENFGKPFR